MQKRKNIEYFCIFTIKVVLLQPFWSGEKKRLEHPSAFC